MKRATFCFRHAEQCLCDFNPRPREEGDTILSSPFCYIIHFNPRPREEGDPSMGGSSIIGDISIHALVKRATTNPDGSFPLWVISIHALVKRATPSSKLHLPSKQISIHALVKRATICRLRHWQRC